MVNDMASSNNPPVYLTQELKEFLVQNCDSNISVGLQALSGMQSRDLAERMVGLIEKFRALKKAVKESM